MAEETLADAAGAVLDRLLGLLPKGGGGSTWADAPPYLRRHAVEHAVDAGRADELLTDADFLVHADPGTLVPALDQARSQEAAEAVAVYRADLGIHRYMTPRDRRAVLALDAYGYRLGTLARALAEGLDPEAPRPRWRTGSRMNSALRDSTSGVSRTVTALAPAQVAGRPALVTGGWSGRLRIWDLLSGRFVGPPLWSHPEVVWRTASVTGTDGHGLLVSADFAGAVQVWDADEDGGTHLGQVPTQYGVPQVACALVDGEPVAVIAQQFSGEGPRMWSLEALDWRGGPPPDAGGTPSALACYEDDGAPMALGAGPGGLVRWNLRTGQRHGDPLPCLPGPAAAACTSVAGRPLAVVVGGRTVQFFELTGPGRVLHTLERAHEDTLYAVDCTVVRDVPVAVTGGHDTTVRTWDMLAGTPYGEPWRLHTDSVVAVACARVAGRPVAATSDRRGLMGVWALGEEPVGDPLPGHRAPVAALSYTRIGDRPVVVSFPSGSQEQVTGWDARTGDPVGPTDGAARTAAEPSVVVAGTEVRLAPGADGTVTVQDTATGHALATLTGHTDRVTALACAQVDGRALAFSAGDDGTLWTWDLERATCLDVWPVLRGVRDLVAVPDAPGEPGALLMALGSDVMVFDLPRAPAPPDPGP
ncbi:WD40 repeat domain-containing protein [Streptomyces sp. WAC06614]|uniref:WD40 repeat domain-containing protein n=1 Tax=Streptomyces sp. WAC06614 TaxID=2487416 RepID=UPI000F796216|nr:WD40 repeat domain-containing protein [Streptomyces sp. WAC06614]RSS78848.1 WD40 repeat domain-containing protein [Streptomyces sp. WAC06614]